MRTLVIIVASLVATYVAFLVATLGITLVSSTYTFYFKMSEEQRRAWREGRGPHG